MEYCSKQTFTETKTSCASRDQLSRYDLLFLHVASFSVPSFPVSLSLASCSTTHARGESHTDRSLRGRVLLTDSQVPSDSSSGSLRATLTDHGRAGRGCPLLLLDDFVFSFTLSVSLITKLRDVKNEPSHLRLACIKALVRQVETARSSPQRFKLTQSGRGAPGGLLHRRRHPTKPGAREAKTFLRGFERAIRACVMNLRKASTCDI